MKNSVYQLTNLHDWYYEDLIERLEKKMIAIFSTNRGNDSSNDGLI